MVFLRRLVLCVGSVEDYGGEDFVGLEEGVVRGREG